MENGGLEPQHQDQQQKKPLIADTRSWLFLGIVIGLAVIVAILVWIMATISVQQNVQQNTPGVAPPTKSTEKPELTTEVVTKGHDSIWEVAFLPTKEMLFTERKGVVHAMKDGKDTVLATIEDVYNQGEGGLMGVAIDPQFLTNRFIYTCFNSKTGGPDVRVVRWKVSDDVKTLSSRTDIITGIPSNPSGRHSGCRMAFGSDGYLWVGTGDTARGDTAAQPKNLGGKILRVDRAGEAAPGNIGGQFDTRIFSYGHRNVQGLAFFPLPQQGVLGISVEHGPDKDDEVNLLKVGNFGWAPAAQGYNENIPMTDTRRFLDAIPAVWSSGTPTIAPSGATFLKGSQWKAWDGFLVIAALKGQQVKVLSISKQNQLASEQQLFAGTFGRLRTAVQGPDGNLYLSTDNASDNQIIRVIPR